LTLIFQRHHWSIIYYLLIVLKNLANSLLREIKILTHPKLRLHPNIVQLCWYDLVEERDETYTPALIMEKAIFGSLSDILENHQSPMSSQVQWSLCLDVCSGLLALHKALVAHGDLKSENVLVFPSPTGSGRYTAKLTDFGSAISLVKPPSGEYPRYQGTPITNAPEVSEQSQTQRLDADGLVYCDNYSLGLLVFQISTRSLDERVIAKTTSVKDTALEIISHTNHPDEFKKVLRNVLENLLAYKPSSRCRDLSIIQNLLQPI
jgi:serine/threonine protein kinase